MAEFEVNVVKIDNVEEHPDADRLTIVTIGGYKCISNKLEDGSWRYNKGDLVVYIPEQAVLPEWLLKRMGFWNEEKGKGYLSGSRGNKVKAIKLRGVISQGVLYPVENYNGIDPTTDESVPCAKVTNGDNKVFGSYEGDNVAERLNITKYEPPIPVQMRGVVGNLVDYTKKYDIENFQKYNDVIRPDEEVVITEKLHGTYCQIGILSGIDESVRQNAVDNNDITHLQDSAYCYVTSKGLGAKGLVQKNVDSNSENLYMKTMNDNLETLKAIADEFLSVTKNFRLYIMGEIYGKGVQDLHYGLNEPDFRVFDVFLVDGDTNTARYLDYEELIGFAEAWKIKMVPLLYKGKFNIDVANQLRIGDTTINNANIREGVVIRPVLEREHAKLGRVQLKYISPDYLLRKGGTENN